MSPTAISEKEVNAYNETSERGINNFRRSVARLRKKIASGNLSTVQIQPDSIRPIDELDIAFGNVANSRWDK